MNVIAPAIALTAGIAAATSAHAQLYQQSPDFSAGFNLVSDGAAGQFFNQQIADNLQLTENAYIDQVAFWGGSQNFSTPDPTNVSGFRIEFFEDDNGSPGESIYSEVVSFLSTNPTFQLAQNAAGGDIYRHEAQLSGGASLNANKTYWIHVGAVLTAPFSDAWMWQSAQTVDQTNGNSPFGADNWTVFDQAGGGLDLSFAVTPAPSAVALLGLAAAAVRRRR